jgi:hypothetical protein
MSHEETELADPAPGPWKLTCFRPEFRKMSEITQADDPDFLIAYVVREWLNEDAQRRDDATARLIAAAPELLEACQYFRDVIGGDLDQQYADEEILEIRITGAAAAYLKRALNKAEGGEQS